MSSQNEKKYSLSCNYSIQDIEALYYEEVLSQDFYDENYGDAWTRQPYIEMAELLKGLLNPKTHLDIGCGIGFLVKSMREQGVDSRGVDFSEAIIRRADTDVKPYLQAASSENWLKKASIKGVEVITYMEVFEHLPVSIIKDILKGISKDLGDGVLFLTIPSYGVDEIFKSGIVTNEGNPEWQRDMEENIPFQNIVLENDKPHFGHITLASYRWWSEFFLTLGFVRYSDLEKKCSELHGSVLEKYNYNPYILKYKDVISDNLIENGIGLGCGWYDYEKEMEGRWTNGYAQFFCFDKRPDSITFCLSFPSINLVQDFSILLVVEQLIEKAGSQFCWRECDISSILSVISRSPRQNFSADFNGDSLSLSDGVGHNVWRLKLISPQWCPNDFHLSTDSRNLSVFVHDIQL